MDVSFNHNIILKYNINYLSIIETTLINNHRGRVRKVNRMKKFMKNEGFLH